MVEEYITIENYYSTSIDSNKKKGNTDYYSKYNIKVYHYCNIHLEAKLGRNCKIGSFTEIGKVIIGDNVTIGAFSFIPEGVTIEDNCWIGPKFCGTNDTYPPSPKSKWGKILIKKGARIGASVTILPDIIINEGALIGAGAVVTCDIPPYEVWAGVPARYIRTLKEDNKL